MRSSRPRATGLNRFRRPVATCPLRSSCAGLLVEDNEINEQVADDLLGQAGIHVSTANHGSPY